MLSFSLDFAFEIDLQPSTAVELMRFRILFSMFHLNFLLNGSGRSDWSVVLALSLSELSSSEDEDVAFVLCLHQGNSLLVGRELGQFIFESVVNALHRHDAWLG